MAKIDNTLILGKAIPGQPSIDKVNDWAEAVRDMKPKEDLTLEEMWKFLREEVKPTNPPLSFTTKMFCEEMGLGKTQAIVELNELEARGLIRKLKQYHITDKRGRRQTVPGWQWNEKTPNP